MRSVGGQERDRSGEELCLEVVAVGPAEELRDGIGEHLDEMIQRRRRRKMKQKKKRV